MDFLTTEEAAELWGISRRRVLYYLKDNRIEGAIRKGSIWLIPNDAKKPNDPRTIKEEKES